MSAQRILVWVSIIGAASLPIWALGTGNAGADSGTDRGPSSCGQPAPGDPAAPPPQCADAPSNAASGSGFELPPGLSEQLNQAAANLPSPVEINVPVGIGLPGIGLPGLSVPIVLPSLGLPAPPQLPSLGVPQLPAPPQLPF